MKKDGVDNPAFELHSPDSLGPRGVPPASPPASSVDASPSVEVGEELCGICGFAPPPLQICNSAKGYLAFYSLLSILQGIIVNGLINVSISTIEKRYDLNSSFTGVISAGYDISFCVLCLFISFYGEKGHKPRWLAFASLMIALGALVFSLPHFTVGAYTYGEKLEDTCPASNPEAYNVTCTSDSKSSISNYFYVFILAQLLLGAGGTPLYTLGTAFIDDSVPKHKASAYIGIGYAMSLLGPAIGYVLGGQLLNVYVDFDRQVSVDLTPEDARWVGAWWIAFVVCGFATSLLVAPFSFFPRQLPGTHKIQAEKVSETHHNGTVVNAEYAGRSMKDFLLALWVLLRNPVLMCLVIAAALEALVATGFATFLPKFIENQFGYTSSYSATLGGLVLVPGAAIGQIISGTLVSKLQLNCKNIIRFIIITCSIALVLNMVFAIAKCGNEPFAGVSETYNGTGTLSNLTAPCNAHCRCMRSEFLPVCGADEVQYFSPCYAGCTSVFVHKHSKVYSQCSCVGDPKIVIENTTAGAIPGKCKSKCTVLPWFLSFFFLTVVFTFMAVTPTTVAILRCVPKGHRSFAMGVHMLFLRLLGSIPGPILFGVSIDHTCTLWSIDKCGIQGACWTYDNKKMAFTLMGISACSKAVSIIFFIVAFILYKPPPGLTPSPRQKDETEISVHL
ncbi:solute carrier organic anion transporter family member 4C1 [Varanus komodoensis]|uniref:solute carrier organic anion transporter family member 4C1 n=1 Tax=Varanus komodoensis TaxID=61221 RepID=UPI001CF7771A|nr:solute carrier organic anion transporter family member 4C1 [Varanus komodoensis]